MKRYRIFKNEWSYFIFRGIKLLDKSERWRRVARILKVSKEARLRLEWIIYYYDYDQGALNASKTARRFGIARKTFHKWFREFNENNLYTLYRLQDKSKAPNKRRLKEISLLQKSRIIKLRKKHIRWGKIKIAMVYKEDYQETVIGKTLRNSTLNFT